MKASLRYWSFFSSKHQIPKTSSSKWVQKFKMCGVFPLLYPKIFKLIIPAAMDALSQKRRILVARCSAEDVKQYLECLPKQVDV